MLKLLRSRRIRVNLISSRSSSSINSRSASSRTESLTPRPMSRRRSASARSSPAVVIREEWLSGRHAGARLACRIERRAVSTLLRQSAPSLGKIEEDRLILGVGALLGLLIAFNGPIQAVFGCVGRRLRSHLSHLFKRELDFYLGRRCSEIDTGDADNLGRRFFGFKVLPLGKILVRLPR
jgi:hypothetical protein